MRMIRVMCIGYCAWEKVWYKSRLLYLLINILKCLCSTRLWSVDPITASWVEFKHSSSLKGLKRYSSLTKCYYYGVEILIFVFWIHFHLNFRVWAEKVSHTFKWNGHINLIFNKLNRADFPWSLKNAVWGITPVYCAVEKKWAQLYVV